jgi:inhibitor of KinA
MEITPLGDSALIIRIRDRFEGAPEKTLNEVQDVFHRLESAAIPGVIELASAYTTIAVFFDPCEIANAGANPDQILDCLAKRIRATVTRGGLPAVAVAKTDDPGRPIPPKSRLVEVQVCYDPEFAFDLDHVARHGHISPRKVVDLHSAAEYRVGCIGFTPGFPFLAGLPKQLATPRRAIPRKEIPAGSVGIGGTQTGIYPLRSPGGWNIIGRTPVRLFDPAKSPPTLLRAGDRVRFRAITRQEFASVAR